MTMGKNTLEHRNYRECLVRLFCKLSLIEKGVFEEEQRRRDHRRSASIRQHPHPPFSPTFHCGFFLRYFISLDLGCGIVKNSEVNLLSFGSS